MSWLEPTCAAIVVLFVVIRALLDDDPAAVLWRLAALAVAAWIGEDTCIRAYGFYAYSREAWSIWLDVTPLMIPLIWPVVIHSSWDLARHLLGRGHRAVVPAAAALVFADAWFIEPIAVRAGLWAWSEPGLFAIPPIGVLGWSLFAVVAFALLERHPGLARRPIGWLTLLTVAPAGCHLLLLASWWGLFRWIHGTVPVWPAVAAAGVLSAVLTSRSLFRAARRRIPLAEMLARVPAAAFFGVLLAATAGAEDAALITWSLLFVPPYLSLVDLG